MTVSAAAPIASATHPGWTFQGVVRLTSVGTMYVLFTVVIGFAALNTGNNALYIGLTFMLACLLLSGVASKGGLKHLRVSVVDVGEAWVGRPADVVLRVRNDSRLWNVRDVIVTSPDIGIPALVPVLPRGKEGEAHVGFIFPRRGRVALSSVDLYTRYPFGFFLKKRRLRLEGDLVVYPKLLDSAAERKVFQLVTGEQNTANRVGPGSEIHSFRDYVPGDSLRHVYWKKSASVGRWIMMQTDEDATSTLHVHVHPLLPRGSSPEQFEQMISAATTFIYHALERGLDVVLQMPGVRVYSKDAGAAHSMFHALALVEATEESVRFEPPEDAVVFALGGRA